MPRNVFVGGSMFLEDDEDFEVDGDNDEDEDFEIEDDEEEDNY